MLARLLVAKVAYEHVPIGGSGGTFWSDTGLNPVFSSMVLTLAESLTLRSSQRSRVL